AFRLGLGKVLVPFVFVFSPSLLLVTSGFNWADFLLAFLGCAIGITALGAALSGFFLVRTKAWEKTKTNGTSTLPSPRRNAVLPVLNGSAPAMPAAA
ncbi:MAG: hypothetical protein EAS49_10935, partial [Brucella intermedia]